MYRKKKNKEQNEKQRQKEMLNGWLGKEIGKYTGPGLLGPTLVKLRKNQFNWELIFRLTEKAAPYKTFKLYEGLSNACACGEIDLEARNFNDHIKDHHYGVVPKGSQINRPPWFDLYFLMMMN